MQENYTASLNSLSDYAYLEVVLGTQLCNGPGTKFKLDVQAMR